MPRLGDYSCGGERESKGYPAVVFSPLIAEVRAERVAALAQDDVFRRTVDVAPIHGEALGGAEVAAHLLDGGGVAAQRLRAGSGDAAY